MAETVQFFITAMDSLKLKMAAVDQLHPILTDLVECLSKIPALGDFEGKHKLKNWWALPSKSYFQWLIHAQQAAKDEYNESK